MASGFLQSSQVFPPGAIYRTCYARFTMNTEEAYKLFMDYGRAERHYTKQTLGKWRDCFQAWILPHLGQSRVEGITRFDLLVFRNKMIDRGLGINRQYSILMCMKLFFKFCQEVLHLGCLDPDREIKLPKRPKPHVHFLTNQEVEQVQNAIPLHTFTGIRLRVLVSVLSSRVIAKPKSSNLTWPPLTKRFVGFTSRWTRCLP